MDEQLIEKVMSEAGYSREAAIIVIRQMDERLITKVMNEMKCNRERAIIVSSKLEKFDPLLKEVIDSWKNDKEIYFEYKGISMTDVMEKQNCRYFEAIIIMWALISNAELADKYSELRFSHSHLKKV